MPIVDKDAYAKYQRAYRELHREKLAAYKRDWRLSNRDDLSAKGRIYNIAHRDTRLMRYAALPAEYHVWCSMKQRCGNPKNKRFERYGGRGITVCERWQSFDNFLVDMGSRPPGTSIDRINNDGNYEPGNCRWATSVEQRANRGDSRKAA